MKAALDYLNLVPGEATEETAVLRDRIYRSGAPGVSEGTPQPPFPFICEDVRVSAAAAAALQQQQATPVPGEMRVDPRARCHALALGCLFWESSGFARVRSHRGHDAVSAAGRSWAR
jgi:hypothetical protein